MAQTSPSIPIRVKDGLILIVAAAVSIWWIRQDLSLRANDPPLEDASDWINVATLWLGMVLVPFGIAVFFGSLTRKRSRLRIAFREYGFVAALLPVVTFFIGFIYTAAILVQKHQIPTRQAIISCHYYLFGINSDMMLGIWLVLLGGRIGRCNRSWTDRMGRLIGCGWLLHFLLSNWTGFLVYLFPFG